jgi:beta-mannosidase
MFQREGFGKMKKTLNGKWQFRKVGDKLYKEATVPGCNYLDLMANGDIPDPFIGLNEKDVYWVGETNWEYKKTFEITEEELNCDDILLTCEMLDTICDVFVNNMLAFSARNCFKAYSVSIKERLDKGENEIRILFRSPVNYVKEKYKSCPTPVNSNGQNGIVHIRKPQCHFGWDWGPVLPCSGITKEISLEFVNGAKIEYLFTSQALNADGTAVISVRADTKAYKDYECSLKVVLPDGSTLEKSGTEADFTITDPELWWTYELSGKAEQPLYEISAAVVSGGKEVDSTSKKIGIRKIELNREKDEYGRNFQFRLNGVPLFIKGTNYIPPDSFITRFTSDKLEYLIDTALFSNINMIRIWGGGYYESDEFYNLCDKKGILVWQDFQFACQAYPFFDNDFLDNVKEEVKYNVKRLCHHPSLAVWNGNNEIEDMHMAWVHMQKYVKWTEKFFYHILEPEIRKYDKNTPYTPGSPVGESHNVGVESDNVGDTHLWGVWHGLKPMNYYRKRMTRFCSEFGFESLPDMKAIEKFAKPSDYSLSSDVFKSHQKCANGNDKMIYYIASRFNLPKELKDYVYLSQVTQNECIADATEHWRRNKGRCNGSMYWQFNDCWGVCSWSSLDYYGNYKALQYGAKHFNAPLSISIENTSDYIRVFVLNDLNESKTVDAEYEIFDFENGTLETNKRTLTVGAVKNSVVFDLNVPFICSEYDKKRTGIAVRLYENDTIIQQKTVLFCRENELHLPKAKLKTVFEETADGLNVTVSSDKYARLVKVESSKSTLPFSDNFFDLLPGQKKAVTIKNDTSISTTELRNSITAYSLSDIPFSNNKLDTKFKQLKVFLSPTNISNAIYHGRLTKDAEITE